MTTRVALAGVARVAAVLRRGSPAVLVGVVRLLAGVAELLVCAVLGAATWALWLAHPLPEGDYSATQVVACAGTVAAVTAVMAVRSNPVAVALGVTAGFEVAWIRDAAASDPTGLYVVGAGLLLCGLVCGTAVSSAVGWNLRRALHDRSRSPAG